MHIIKNFSCSGTFTHGKETEMGSGRGGRKIRPHLEERYYFVYMVSERENLFVHLNTSTGSQNGGARREMHPAGLYRNLPLHRDYKLEEDYFLFNTITISPFSEDE